jgi:hypothetical protein
MLEEKLAEMKEQLPQTVASKVRDLEQSLGAATAVLEDEEPDDHGPEDEEQRPEDDGEPLHEAKGRNGFPNLVKIHVHPTTRMNNKRQRRGRQSAVFYLCATPCCVQCDQIFPLTYVMNLSTFCPLEKNWPPSPPILHCFASTAMTYSAELNLIQSVQPKKMWDRIPKTNLV